MVKTISTIIEKDLRLKEEYLRQNPDYRKREELYHQHKAGAYIKDLVYGANDGIITTFAVVAGATGASLSPMIVIILGFANLFADGLSMGAGNYLGIKSEQDYQKAQRKKEEWEIDHLRNLEVGEIRDIYAERGFGGKDLENAVAITIADRKRWVDVMMKDEMGIIEDVKVGPLKHGLATFLAFVLAGLVPLLAYLFPSGGDATFKVSLFLTALTLFVIGALRSRVTLVGWWRGGTEMLLIGSGAAGAAYFIGYFIEKLVG
ncbi:MAG: VIT1/CCC1 transporter family protein [bacterium]|nr:VIT1/CCC1 transporter family protein [bacterium]